MDALQEQVQEDFYSAPEGQMLLKLLAQDIKKLWPSINNEKILGVGIDNNILEKIVDGDNTLYASDDYRHSSDKLLSYIFGFPEAHFDRAIVNINNYITQPYHSLLRELWRILKPKGQLILIMPNKLNIWKNYVACPLTIGRSFNQFELLQLIDNSLFQLRGSHSALFLSPALHKAMPEMAASLEELWHKLPLPFGAIWLVLAEKKAASSLQEIKTQKRSIKFKFKNCTINASTHLKIDGLEGKKSRTGSYASRIFKLNKHNTFINNEQI
jgi:hypothetical protein